MVNIDVERCIGCGLCADDCVGKVIEIEDGKAKIVGKCILCGHCVAICPMSAPSIDDYDMSEVKEYDKAAFDVDPDVLLNSMKFRRSIRQFTDAPVSEEELARALEAGRYAPTGVNMQDVRFVVVKERLDEFKKLIYEGWRRLSIELSKTSPSKGERYMGYYNAFTENPKNDRLFLNAPLVVVIASDMKVNAGIAAAYMEMFLHADGMAALFDGYLVYALDFCDGAREFLNIGKKTPMAALLIGKTDVNYLRTVPRRSADIVRL